MQSSWLYSSIWRRSESSRVCIHCSKIDDRGAAVLHLRLPLEVEEGLELLQPVARPRGAEAVADDAVEVDEDLAAEEVVELALAGAVAAHQPLERGDLVGRVVVDVQVGVAREPLVHEVDEGLERDPLGLVVVRVERRRSCRRRRGSPRGTRASRPRPRTGCPRSRRRGRRARGRAGARSRLPAAAGGAGRCRRRSRAR